MFGAQSSASLFGAPTSAQPGALFGAASAGGQSPLLAGTSQAGGLFGGRAASATLFATPASSGSLFGAPASSAGGLFGTPTASSASLFGTPAASSGGGLFGTPAASSGGGLFGTPAASGSLFGAPAAGGSLLGASSASIFSSAPSSGGLFGAPASSAGLFGAASSAGLFGAPAAQASTSLFAPSTAVSPWGALPSTAQPAATGLPPGQDPAHFYAEQAAIKNGLEVRTFRVHGVQQLKAHHDAQQAALQDNRNCLAELRAVVHVARQGTGSNSTLQKRSEHLLEQHSRLSHLLLQTIRLVDALAVRIVTAADCRSMDATLEDVGRQISQIEAHLAPNNVQGLKHQVDTLRSQMQGLVAENGSASTVGVDESSLKQAAHILQEHNKGIKRLQGHMDKVERDVNLMVHLSGEGRVGAL